MKKKHKAMIQEPLLKNEVPIVEPLFEEEPTPVTPLLFTEEYAAPDRKLLIMLSGGGCHTVRDKVFYFPEEVDKYFSSTKVIPCTDGWNVFIDGIVAWMLV